MQTAFFDRRVNAPAISFEPLTQAAIEYFVTVKSNNYQQDGQLCMALADDKGNFHFHHVHYPSCQSVFFVEHLDVGNEALRFSALMRNLAAIIGAKQAVFITDHPDFFANFKDGLHAAIFNQSPRSGNWYGLIDDELEYTSGFFYDAKVREHEYVLDRTVQSQYLTLGGLTNVFDQEYFLKTALSLAFTAAAIKHAWSLHHRVEK
jgi:hypothetical protein